MRPKLATLGFDLFGFGLRPGPRCPLRATAALVVLTGLFGLAPPSRGAQIEGDRATFAWGPASGPVDGYEVFVSRNGGAMSGPEQVVSGTSATVSSVIGDSIVVQVRAVDSTGRTGPMSAPSEDVVFVQGSEPPPPTSDPGTVVVTAPGDYSLVDALASATSGEQVSTTFTGSGKQLLDVSLPEQDLGDTLWGVDQLVVGAPDAPTTVRLLDAAGFDTSQTPLVNLPEVTLFGLGAGLPCEREEPGLVINAGSRLVLGGVDLNVFDGQSCVHVNELFAQSPDPNRIAWGDGEILLYGDLEEDGVLDPDDNCLLLANVDQCDTDRDGFGNVCDYDVDGDNVVEWSDLMAVLRVVMTSSQDLTYDLNCDGGVGPDDLSLVKPHAYEVPGPSGLACAADATCESP